MAVNQEAQQAETQALDLPKPEMPTLSRQFSNSARFFQRMSRALVSIALVLIGISTLASAVHSLIPHFLLLGYQVNYATAIAALFFLIASLIRLYRIIRRPERAWFGSRVLAERTKSLVWSYAVAGAPFLRSGAPVEINEKYQQALNDAASEAGQGGIRYHTPRKGQEIQVITAWMREIRAKDLDERRGIYAKQRIRDQENYYSTHEREYSRKAVIWQWVLYGIEFAGAILAALTALAVIPLDMVGVVGTIAAGLAAWVQFNQFTELAGAYDAMAYRMAGYREECTDNATPWSEERWVKFVEKVEGALDEEHGAWRRIVKEGARDVS